MRTNDEPLTTVTKHFIPDNFSRIGGLWPVRMGRNTTSNNKMDPKIIECFNVHFVLEGTIEFAFENNEATLTSGDVFCMYPGISYTYKSVSNDNPLHIIWITFDGAQSPLLIDMAGFTRSVPYLRDVINDTMETTLRQMFTFHEHDKKIHIDLYACLYRLFSCIIEQQPQEETPMEPARWITKSMEYMNAHYTEQITVQDVADYISVHRVYFSRLFTQQTGVSPKQYLQKLKMNRAVQLLRHSPHSITEISHSLGYSDLYAFTRAFSKYYQFPPSVLRKK